MLRLPKIPPAALGPILIASVLVLLAFWFTPPARPILAPPSAVGVPAAPERPRAPGEPTPSPAPLIGDTATASAGGLIVLTTAEGLFDAQEQARFAADLDRALDYVVQRFGTAPKGPISTFAGLEPGCGIHGIAYTDVRTVQVFTCRDLPASRAVNILAHEFVHQLCHDRYGDRHLSTDLILSEGTATWGAGQYWLGDAASFRQFVRPWLESGSEIPLSESYVGRPIADMNQLYYQWASFVEYLIENYGREKFDQLYLTGDNYPASADYLGVYGKQFEQLEAEWKAWVLQ
jgi:hypothetical protein